MKKNALALATIVLAFVATTLPALAHIKPNDSAHINPHWLPGAICIGALAIFAIAICWWNFRKRDDN